MKNIEIQSDVFGTVWKVLVKPGDQVEAGDSLVIIESMKMEIPHSAEYAAIVLEVFTEEGSSVDEGTVLVTLQERQ